MNKPKYKVEVYTDIVGGYRWRIKASNGKLVGCSGEGFKRSGAALRSFHKTAKMIGWGHYNIDIITK